MPEHTLNTILDLQKRGQLSQRIQHLRRVLRSDSDAFDAAEARYHLGVALTDKGSYPEGLRCLKAAEEEFRSLERPEQMAFCLAEQALNYHRRAGDREQHKALELLKEAQQVLKKAEGVEKSFLHEALAKIAFYFAVVYNYRGEWKAAYDFYQSAYELYQDNPYELAKVHDSLGRYYASLGRPTLARLYYERSIEHKRESGDLFGLTMSLNNLGRLLLDRGLYREAKNALQESLTLCRDIQNTHGIAINLNELGRVCLQLRELEEARELLGQCLEACGRKYAKTRGLAHKNFAKACLLQDETQEGLGHIKRSLNLFRCITYAEGLGIARRIQGRLLAAQELPRKAVNAFQLAIENFREAQKAREIAVTLSYLAAAQEELGEHDTALDSLKQALQVAEGLHDDRVVQRVQDELHRIAPLEALTVAIQRQLGKETAALNASLCGHQEEVSILFSDIRGFTHFSAQTPARDVVDTLNEYFWQMTRVVSEFHGQVDKFIGDGLMVTFRGSDRGHHPYRAVCAALKMLERLRDLNRERKRLGLWELEIRIGIHSGEAIIGNIGSYEKMDYTAIGSTVNLAQRLESHARPNTILISKAAYQQISGHFHCFHRLPFIPKGFEREVENWEVQSAKDLVRFRPRFMNAREQEERRPGLINLSILRNAEKNPGLQDCDEDECMASLIYRHPHLVTDDAGDLGIEELEMLLPLPLDFDLIAAAYFVQQILEHGVLPVGARELSVYARQVASNRLPKNGHSWNTAHGVFHGIFEKDRRYCEARSLSGKTSHTYRLQRGFYLMEYLCLKVSEGFNLDDPRLFEDDSPFEQERRLMRDNT